MAAVRAFDDVLRAKKEAGELPQEIAAATQRALLELGDAVKGIDRCPREQAVQQQEPARKREGRQPLDWRVLSRVRYGEAPGGYREIQEARGLTRGEKYSVVAFGAVAFECARDFFVA
jgi:hypothetical protein